MHFHPSRRFNGASSPWWWKRGTRSARSHNLNDKFIIRDRFPSAFHNAHQQFTSEAGVLREKVFATNTAAAVAHGDKECDCDIA